MSGWSAAPPVLLISKAKATAKAVARGRGARGPELASVLRQVASRPSDRSRSPPRVGLPGLRGDAPGRLERQFAGLPHLIDADSREAALGALDRDILAASTQRTNEARLRTIEAALRMWGIPLWPPTLVAWKALVATLKNWAAMRRRRCISQRTRQWQNGEDMCWMTSQ